MLKKTPDFDLFNVCKSKLESLIVICFRNSFSLNHKFAGLITPRKQIKFNVT